MLSIYHTDYFETINNIENPEEITKIKIIYNCPNLNKDNYETVQIYIGDEIAKFIWLEYISHDFFIEGCHLTTTSGKLMNDCCIGGEYMLSRDYNIFGIPNTVKYLNLCSCHPDTIKNISGSSIVKLHLNLDGDFDEIDFVPPTTLNEVKFTLNYYVGLRKKRKELANLKKMIKRLKFSKKCKIIINDEIEETGYC